MTLVHLLNYYYLLTLSRCNKKNPLESPGSGRIMTRIRTKVKWFVACDTSHPSIIYKNSSSLLNYKQHSSICQYPTMIKIPFKNSRIASWSGSPPESNRLLLVTNLTPPGMSSTFVDNLWVILLTDKHTQRHKLNLFKLLLLLLKILVSYRYKTHNSSNRSCKR